MDDVEKSSDVQHSNNPTNNLNAETCLEKGTTYASLDKLFESY